MNKHRLSEIQIWNWSVWADPECTKWATEQDHPSNMEIIAEAEARGWVEIEDEPEDSESHEMCEWVDANEQDALEYIWKSEQKRLAS